MRGRQQLAATLAHPMRTLIQDNYLKSTRLSVAERNLLAEYFEVARPNLSKKALLNFLSSSVKDNSSMFAGNISVVLMSYSDFGGQMSDVRVADLFSHANQEKMLYHLKIMSQVWDYFFIVVFQLNKFLRSDPQLRSSAAEFFRRFGKARDITSLDHISFPIEELARFGYLMQKKLEDLGLELKVEAVVKQKVTDDMVLIHPVVVSNPKTNASLPIFLYTAKFSESSDYFLQYFEYSVLRRSNPNTIGLPGDQGELEKVIQQMDSIPKAWLDDPKVEPINLIKTHLEILINPGKSA